MFNVLQMYINCTVSEGQAVARVDVCVRLCVCVVRATNLVKAMALFNNQYFIAN